ncbi:hypothetical protein CO614_03640 [Lysobacteraceae bacterium NML120232]|nr:hypothetical protein CO608_02520 [Xanthomonadaceae bacterium NML08-0793]PJK12653.1 hypothetical protein CO614_03640 [Xanthomonadaceae bacterium NML120232]
MNASSAPQFSLTGLLLLCLGATGAAALWVLIALGFNLSSSLLAFLAALDLILMMRLARLAPGFWRGMQASLGTVFAIALAQWCLMGIRTGLQLGLLPAESIPKMSLGFAWTLSGFWLTPFDMCLYAAAIVLALLFGR